MSFETVEALPPEDIVNTYNAQKKPADRLNALWDSFKNQTIDRIAAGCICMADIWASAWKEGKGETIDRTLLKAIDQDALSQLYRNSKFFPSSSLRLMIPILTGAPVSSEQPPARKAVAKKAAGKSGR